MRVGVLTGLAAEARLLTNVLFDGKAELRIVRTGADPERARREAKDLVTSGVSALVSFGVAGGLCPTLDAGDLILADHVILPDGRSVAADTAWIRLARQRLGKTGHKTVIGPVAASDRLLATPAEKRRLSELSGGIAGDMESGAVAAVAHEAGLPFLVVRAVSDSATRILPRVARVPLRPCGGLSIGSIAHALVAAPGEWPAVARLAIETRAAMTTLRRAVHAGALLPPYIPGIEKPAA
jgi:adenosylhomocysteine nucleosidase